ncbi:MAG TPA: hypothetical protein DCR44_05900 [Acholeplasmatales bacterium]|nr:MAG: hypothetical protein A2Y16_06130 [Tenericutes bacterium GWF2_57_13]HAQ56911.1 hypothetical protein [Acholeplasmatales bacterium]
MNNKYAEYIDRLTALGIATEQEVDIDDPVEFGRLTAAFLKNEILPEDVLVEDFGWEDVDDFDEIARLEALYDDKQDLPPGVRAQLYPDGSGRFERYEVRFYRIEPVPQEDLDVDLALVNAANLAKSTKYLRFFYGLAIIGLIVGGAVLVYLLFR